MVKSVLVTGASTGLGMATAIYLAQQGFNVYASMLDLNQRMAIDKAAKHLGVRLNVLKLDITKKEDINEVVSTIVSQSGGIYGLVNNAGIGLRGYFEDLSEEEIRSVFEINVFGTMAITKAVLPYMRAARVGRIVIISSIGGRISSLGVSAYCATKFAQEGFGEALSQELIPFKIYVSLVEPAIVKTERWGINRGVAKGSTNPKSPYYKWFQESERLVDYIVNTSPTKPIDVAKDVYKALTQRRPKLRYLVGRRANLIMKLMRYTPGELFERFYFNKAVRYVTEGKLRKVE